MTRKPPSLPTVTERVDLCLTHLRLALVHFDEGHAITSLRRHYSGYFRGLRGAAALRNELAQHRDPEALIQRLGEIRSGGCFAATPRPSELARDGQRGVADRRRRSR